MQATGEFQSATPKLRQTFAGKRYILCLMLVVTRYIVVIRAVVYDHVHFECIATSGRASNGTFEWLSISRPEIPFEWGTGVLPQK
ncbi:hypothetical protein ABIC50_005203 [Burkholderia sp. 567]|jgi:hypothetical protein